MLIIVRLVRLVFAVHISDHLIMRLLVITLQYVLTGLGVESMLERITEHTRPQTQQTLTHTDKCKHAHWCWAIWCTEVTPAPPPLLLALSGFRLNLTPHTWPLGLGSVLDERRPQLWGRVHSRTDSPLTKGEIQLEHISVQVVEYHSF